MKGSIAIACHQESTYTDGWKKNRGLSGVTLLRGRAPRGRKRQRSQTHEDAGKGPGRPRPTRSGERSAAAPPARQGLVLVVHLVWSPLRNKPYRQGDWSSDHVNRWVRPRDRQHPL